MSLVYREFVMDFNKLARPVVNLLIKSHRHLVGVNLFQVPSFPSLSAWDIKPVASTTRGQIFPIGEFALVLFTCVHLIL